MMDDSADLHRAAQSGDGLRMIRPDLGYVLYRSIARPGLSQADMDAILEKARAWNRSVGLTGCLHHEGGLFFQWLEGPRVALFQLVERLRDDEKHLNVTILDQGPLEQRMFKDWDMRFSDPETASLLDWLATRREGNRVDTGDGQSVGDFLTSLQR